jgi:hypothetical protein
MGNELIDAGTGAAGGAIAGAEVGGPWGALAGGIIGGGLGLLEGSGGSSDAPDPSIAAANLLQQQFKDWQTTFEPVELQALNQVSLNNSAVLPNALQEADANVSGAYGQMPGILSRQNRALGINPTPQQTKSTNRMINVNQSLATAGAENTARAGVRQMDQQLLM